MKLSDHVKYFSDVLFIVVIVGLVMLIAASLLPTSRLDGPSSNLAKHLDEVQEVNRQYAKATTHAVYHLALPYLTDEQADTFERRLDAVNEEHEDAAQQYSAISSDMAFTALYGITADDPTETLMSKAREKMLDAKFDRRKIMILELQHLSQMALSARQRATRISVRGEELERAHRDFERAKKLITAALMKYSELYPSAPTH